MRRARIAIARQPLVVGFVMAGLVALNIASFWAAAHESARRPGSAVFDLLLGVVGFVVLAWYVREFRRGRRGE